jgi:hypothetical protein
MGVSWLKDVTYRHGRCYRTSCEGSYNADAVSLANLSVPGRKTKVSSGRLHTAQINSADKPQFGYLGQNGPGVSRQRMEGRQAV